MSEHPIPGRLETMAERFENIDYSFTKRNDKPRVDFNIGMHPMHQPTSPDDPACGSVACHAGWAGMCLAVRDNKQSDYFYSAAAYLAKFLNPDWSEAYDFEEWADIHPELWGNSEGVVMFEANGYRAFGFYDSNKEKCDLLAIAKHYREVAKRIRGAL